MQIDQEAEKFLEILAGEIESPSKEDGGADAEALSDEVIQGNASQKLAKVCAIEQLIERCRSENQPPFLSG